MLKKEAIFIPYLKKMRTLHIFIPDHLKKDER